MPQLSLENHTLHYLATGNPSHPPLLMLHGFMGSGQDFATSLPSLAENFYCIVPDLPGHGETLTNAGGYTFERTAQALLALLDHLNISQSHLLGYSMGGRLALYLVCYFPEYFRRAVLESASPGLKTVEERQERIKKDQALAHQLETTPLSDFLERWYSNPLFSKIKERPQAYAEMLQRRQNNNPTELAKALPGMSTGRQLSLWPHLPNLKCTLLLLVGALDPKFVAINRDMYAQCLPSQTTLTILKGCDHNLHLLAPEPYIKAIIPFLLTATP